MTMDIPEYSFAEQATQSLRRLYSRRGYAPYRMSKFEEYDLYARNKDFLISDSVLTFTDATGRLLALKPDVTLSIIKNSHDRPEDIQKVYYTENVYRADKTTHTFKEIMQVGLECFGHIDDYHIAEVISLAAASLQALSEDWVLDISHLGLLDSVMDNLGLPADSKVEALACIGEKNSHELTALCRREGLPEEAIALLTGLVTTAGLPGEVLPQLTALLEGTVDTAPLESLKRVLSAVDDPRLTGRLRLDFSVVDNIKYYNGMVFKGFVSGIPTGVLSGGQYDKLMERLGRRSGAIGFAVYLDALEPLAAPRPVYDVDAVLLYDEGADTAALHQRVRALIDAGKSVLAARQIPMDIAYRQLWQFENGEVTEIENHA